jgi:photosystem II stability/assembly factor-like uncharacterized protein
MRFVIAFVIGLIFGSAALISPVDAASRPKEPALQENFYGVHISEQRAWIVGYYGTILHSADRGQTWEIQASPTQRALYSVQFVEPLTGWISGSYGTALHTRDGGKSWRASSVATSEHLFASDWRSESHGWFVGSRGITIRTSDGGRSWTKSSVPGDFTFSAVKFVSALRGWVAGEFGVIFRTEDGGKTWEKQKSPIEVSFASGASQNLFALLFPSPSVGYAFGLDGVVLRTHDGAAWEIVRQPESTNGATHHLFAAAAFNEHISAVGERGTLLQLDSLSQWRRADLQIPRLSLNAIAFGSDGFGLMVGNRGLVVRTADGGKTWQRLKIDLRPSAKDNRAP